MAAPKNMTPEQRSRRASIAARTRWTMEDPKPQAERGQAGLREKFRREVIAAAEVKGEKISEAEIIRRANAKYSLHMTRLAERRQARRKVA